MKVMVTGAGGMLGQDILKVFSDLNVKGYPRAELDITEEEQVKEAIFDFNPHLLINCAAFTKVDLCETQKEDAFRINGEGPKILAKYCNEINCKLVHISTDYVFDGSSNVPYSENSPTCPINVYGESKLKGEEYIKEISKAFLIIRTSWLFGKHGPNFIKTILDIAKERESLQVVNDQRGCPTFTKDLATGIRHLINKEAQGIINVTNTGACTWFDLAKYVFLLRGLKKEIAPVNSNAFKRPAKRPKYSVLSSKKYRKTVGSSLRHWQEAVSDYINSFYE